MLRDQNKKMESLMSQNKALQELLAKISNNIKGDHFLALTQDDVRNQSKNTRNSTLELPLLKARGRFIMMGKASGSGSKHPEIAMLRSYIFHPSAMRTPVRLG